MAVKVYPVICCDGCGQPLALQPALSSFQVLSIDVEVTPRRHEVLFCHRSCGVTTKWRLSEGMPNAVLKTTS